MASHVQGIAITIKAFLPTGKTLDEQFTALSIVKDAHASGDYSKVLAAAKIDEVKAEQKTRRIEDQPQTETDKTEDESGLKEAFDKVETDKIEEAVNPPKIATQIYSESDEGVPAFIKEGKRKSA